MNQEENDDHSSSNVQQPSSLLNYEYYENNVGDNTQNAEELNNLIGNFEVQPDDFDNSNCDDGPGPGELDSNERGDRVMFFIVNNFLSFFFPMFFPCIMLIR